MMVRLLRERTQRVGKVNGSSPVSGYRAVFVDARSDGVRCLSMEWPMGRYRAVSPDVQSGASHNSVCGMA